ncbi:hypothetical protein ATK36_0432 [Amycolatopsis sulphurea]|uniref:Uncharacterized protein n=1 Tax=Amycolatopsis sulphurea TaxID=76022 RepID=A0A2A9G1S0_9PSEU|nr:hypothetical protein [Amycolatopsis sulphurea]PFG56896.1 hypothetical protein ATK36_0432 [Amycolatopsis sulphurea]
MSALIYIDLTVARPVIDGVWHLAGLSVVPAPGEEITTPCGAAGPVVFVPSSERGRDGVPAQCLHCDVQERRRLGYEIRADHPGLHPRTRPGRR